MLKTIFYSLLLLLAPFSLVYSSSSEQVAFQTNSIDFNSPSALEQNQEMAPPSSYKSAFIKMILSLIALLAFLFASVWVLRRISQGRLLQMNHQRSIKILERRPLSAKSILYLVDVNGKQVLICESQYEVRRIIDVETTAMSESHP